MTALMHITTARRRLNARTLAILQTAVAALAAWYVCIALLPDEQPVFACIAAVIAIGASHGQHRQRATQLVLGVVTGLAVADVIIHFIGTGAPQLAIMVVLAMSVAVLLNGSELVISEAAVSAMLLVITGPSGRRRVLAEPDPRGRDRRRRRARRSPCSSRRTRSCPSAAPRRPSSAASAARWRARPPRWTTGDPDARRAGARAGALDRGPAARPRRRAGHQPRDRAHRADALRRPRADRPLRPLARADRLRRAQHASACAPFPARDRGAARRRSRCATRSPISPAPCGRWPRPTTSPSGPTRRASWRPPRPCGRRRWAWARGSRYAEVAAPVRSTAVDLMRAAELVAGAPEELPTEELLLQPAPIEETGWVLTLA